MKQSLYDFCLENGKGYLLVQWDTAGNLPDTPRTLSPGSRKQVWWVCDHGHRWQAAVQNRTARDNNCPVCAGKQVLPGFNDLASRYPQLAAQWHPTKNGPLTPDQVTPGTHRKVWWVCPEGHRWQASIGARTAGSTGCPVCAGKQVLPGVNDLASLHPELAAQWHPNKNLPLTPDTIAGNSNRSVWWICGLGHEWQAPVGRRVQSQVGCPVCAGKQVLVGFNDLGTMDPAVAAQWAQDLNGSLTPQSVTVGSGKKVWWRCDQNHVWRAKIYTRTGPQRSGCPVCAGRFKPRYRNIRE